MDTWIKPSNIVVVGTSAGGFSAASKLLANFPDNINAAVFLVIHVSKNSMTQIIVNHIQKHTELICRVAIDGEQIKNGVVYLAPADNHMLIDDDKILVQKGAYENHFRPSIDVLFRSAAANYGSCVTGVILTGMLDDGTSGMYAIKKSGGICIVQDPQEAEFPTMPETVLRNLEVDYTLPVAEIGYVIADLLLDRACIPEEIPKEVTFEAEITKRMSSEIVNLTPLGEGTMFTCPDCGGVIRKIYDDAITRYRCFTGHTFTEASLMENQVRKLEESLWTAVRMMEERKHLLRGLGEESDTASERASQMEIHIRRLKGMLQNLRPEEETS
jgi:two-component system chemotaxis response regulator CheB